MGLISLPSNLVRNQWLRVAVVLTVLATVLAIVPRSASAATNLIVNGGFETGNSSSWTVVSGDVDVVSGWQPSEGTYSLDLNGFFPATISQSFSTVSGKTYQVLFDLAGNPGNGGTVTGTVSAAGQSANFSFNTSGRSTTNMGWTPQTFNFTANAGTTTLTFASTTNGPVCLSPNFAACGPALDNIRVFVVNAAPTVQTTPAGSTFSVPPSPTGTVYTLSGSNGVSVTASGIWSCGGGITGCPFGPNGSGSPAGTGFLAPGISTMSLVARVGSGPWQFVGAGPTTITGTGTVQFAMNDDYFGDNVGSMTVVVSSAVVFNEGTIATQAGTYNDTDAVDNVSITASVGTVTKTGTNTGTWSWSNSTPDGPASYTVVITANDGFGGTATTSFLAVIKNVAPTATFSNNGPVNEGSDIMLSLTSPQDVAADLGSLQYAFDCGSGYGSYGASSTANCPTTDNGTRNVKGKVKDKDGGESEYTATVTVNNVAPDLQISGANTVYYTNWTSANVAGGTAAGVITLPDASTINVSLNTSSGGFFGAQTNGGTNFWVPATPYISAQVPNAPPDSDIIQLQGGTSTVYTVTFSHPIVDPIMAILSLGSGGNVITYDFNAPFTIVSQGSGFWGGCSTCLRIKPGDVLEGQEGHGTIKFLGTYSSFSWTVPNPEAWHGFTFAVRSSQALAQTVIVNEGQTATNNGTFADVPADVVSITSSIGTVTKSGSSSGTWTWSFPTNDGPVQSQTVTITASDEDGGVTSKSFPLVVNNVAPTITNAFQVAPIMEASVSVSGNLVVQATDPAGSNDPLVYEFDCDNNGTFETQAHPNTFAADCFFPDNGNFTVGVRVSDGDGGVATGTIIAKVTNVAPIATAFGSVINENGSATVNGTFFDPSPVDTFTVTINWSEGAPTVLTLGAGANSYSATHQYLDDDPTGTQFDVYAVSVTVKDDDGGVGAANTTVQVNNVAPQVTATGATISENGTATVSGTISDVGTKDTFTVVITWGPGEGSTMLTPPAGSTTFSATHQYLDDNPTGTLSDTYPITVTVTDDDGGVGAANTTVQVNNVAPQVTATGATIAEGGTATVSATFSDVGTLDTFTVVINWGAGEGSETITLPVGTTTFSATHQYLDDNPTGTLSDTYNVSVTVTDDDGGVGTANAPVVVNNVNPVATASASPTSQYWGLNVNFTGSATDVGTLDTLTYAWDFGDASSGSGTSTTHAYANPGAYTSKLTVTDDDTGKDEKTVGITVNKRGTALAYTGPATVTFGPSITLTATLSDLVDVPTQQLAGKTVTFTIDGSTVLNGTTDANGNVSVSTAAFVMPGAHTVAVAFAGDTHYLASGASATLTIQCTTGCKVTAGTLRGSNNGRGGFNVQYDDKGRLKGELEYKNNSIDYHANTMTALGVSPDGKKAWFAGTDKNGVVFTAYVEDNGEPGTSDVFQISINGVVQNGNGALTRGNVQIHCGKVDDDEDDDHKDGKSDDGKSGKSDDSGKSDSNKDKPKK